MERKEAPPPVLVTVMKHVATLAERLQIAHPIVGWIMVEVRSRQRYLGCADSDAVADSSKAGQGPPASIAPGLFLFVPPSAIA